MAFGGDPSANITDEGLLAKGGGYGVGGTPPTPPPPAFSFGPYGGAGQTAPQLGGTDTGGYRRRRALGMMVAPQPPDAMTQMAQMGTPSDAAVSAGLGSRGSAPMTASPTGPIGDWFQQGPPVTPNPNDPGGGTDFYGRHFEDILLQLLSGGGTGMFDPGGSQQMRDLIKRNFVTDLGNRQNVARTQAALYGGGDPSLGNYASIVGQQGAFHDYATGLNSAMAQNANSIQDYLRQLASVYFQTKYGHDLGLEMKRTH